MYMTLGVVIEIYNSYFISTFFYIKFYYTHIFINVQNICKKKSMTFDLLIYMNTFISSNCQIHFEDTKAM